MKIYGIVEIRKFLLKYEKNREIAKVGRQKLTKLLTLSQLKIIFI